MPRAEGKTGEHVILGLVQGALPDTTRVLCPASGSVEPMLNSPRHGLRQGLHRRGVGVLLAPVGLVIEVWNGDGTASTWSAEHGGCALSVPAGTVAGPCIPVVERVETGADADFMTARDAAFAIDKGRTYWLTLRFAQPADTHGVLVAQLRADAPDGPLLQQARVSITLPAWTSADPIEVVVGRTGAEFPEHRYPPADVVFSLNRLERALEAR